MLFPLLFLLLDSDADRQFFEDLYTQYHRLMYAQALQITKDSSTAQDVISDSLMALMKKIDLLRTLPCNKLRAYAVITVKHMALNRYKQKKRENVAGDIAVEDLAGQGSVDENLLSQAGIEQVKAAICALPEREKQIMLMKYFRELTDEEIAEEMGVKPVSVRVHLSRARKHLAQMLEGRGSDA